MTTFCNVDVCRKSSAYNQTGQSYFEQLTAFNHMSAHLRRVLLARSVVDSRNNKYKQTRCRSKSSCRSKSVEKIISTTNIVDRLAYDTEHHPIDVVRMSVERNSGHNRKDNRCFRLMCTCYNNSYIQNRSEGSSKGIKEARYNSEVDKRLGLNSRSKATKLVCSSMKPKGQSSQCKSARPSRFTGSCNGERQPVDKIEWKRCLCDSKQTKPDLGNNSAGIEQQSYDYDSSFESCAVSSSRDSPISKKSPRDRESPSSIESHGESIDTSVSSARRIRNNSDAFQREEDAKYAKFLYDITQEIMINGLYTDHELQAIFKKHIDMNSETLDKNRMQSEIYQMKMSLNVMEWSEDDDDEEDVECFVGSGRFANFSPDKPPTPPKILDDDKIMEKLRNHEEISRLDEMRRKARGSRSGRNTVVLVDANPELFITERDVLLTLMEMKLDPQQANSICKSLQNKSRDTSLTKTAKVDTEVSCFPQWMEDRETSPMTSRTDVQSLYHPEMSISTTVPEFGQRKRYNPINRRQDESTGTISLRDRMTQGVTVERKSQHCHCQAKENHTMMRHASDEFREAKIRKPEESSINKSKTEIAIQALLADAKENLTRDETMSVIQNRIAEEIAKGNRPRSSNSRKTPEVLQTHQIQPIHNRNSTITKVSIGNYSKTPVNFVASSKNKNDENFKADLRKNKNKKENTTKKSGGEKMIDKSEVNFKMTSKSEEKENIENIDKISKNIGRKRSEKVKKSTSSESNKVTIDDSNASNKTNQLDGTTDNTILVEVAPITENVKIREENNPLPDISERSEGIAEDIASDEIVTSNSDMSDNASISGDFDQVQPDSDAEISGVPKQISRSTKPSDLEQFPSLVVTPQPRDYPPATVTELDSRKPIQTDISETTELLEVVEELEEPETSATTENSHLDGAISLPNPHSGGIVSKVDDVDKGGEEDKKKAQVDGPSLVIQKRSIEKKTKQFKTSTKSESKIKNSSKDNADMENKNQVEDVTTENVAAAGKKSENKVEDEVIRERRKIDEELKNSETLEIRRSFDQKSNGKKSSIAATYIGISELGTSSENVAKRRNDRGRRTRTTFKEESPTRESDVSSPRNSYRDDSTQSSVSLGESIDDNNHKTVQVSKQNENDASTSKGISFASIYPLPWIDPDSGGISVVNGVRDRQKFELSGQRRNTIQRRTSLAHRIRSIVETLKRRSSASTNAPRDSQRIPAKFEDTSSATTPCKSNKNINEIEDSNDKTKQNSQNIESPKATINNQSSGRDFPLTKDTGTESPASIFSDASQKSQNTRDLGTSTNSLMTNANAMGTCRFDCRGWLLPHN